MLSEYRIDKTKISEAEAVQAGEMKESPEEQSVPVISTRRLIITPTEVLLHRNPESSIRIDKETFHISILQGGFEPERVPSVINGGNIAQVLTAAGYQRVSRVDVDHNIIARLQENQPDFGFMSMFCKWGEDGVLQALLEVMEIPYSGCGVEASAICKDKSAFTVFAKGLGLDVPDTHVFDTQEEVLAHASTLTYPCIVKPAHQGYSLGVTYVEKEEDLKNAVTEAFGLSTRILIQDYIEGKELTVGVLDIPGEGPVVLPVIELQLKRPIQSTEVKEVDGLVEECIADLTEEEQRTLETAVLRLYKALECVGVSRFDVRQQKSTGKFYFLENNTCPGLFEDSDLPKQLEAAGISLEQYVDYMILSGLIRRKTKLDYTFE